MGIRDPVKSRNLPFGGRGGRCVGAVSRAGPEEEILLPFLNEYCTIKSDILECLVFHNGHAVPTWEDPEVCGGWLSGAQLAKSIHAQTAAKIAAIHF